VKNLLLKNRFCVHVRFVGYAQSFASW